MDSVAQNAPGKLKGHGRDLLGLVGRRALASPSVCGAPRVCVAGCISGEVSTSDMIDIASTPDLSSMVSPATLAERVKPFLRMDEERVEARSSTDCEIPGAENDSLAPSPLFPIISAAAPSNSELTISVAISSSTPVLLPGGCFFFAPPFTCCTLDSRISAASKVG